MTALVLAGHGSSVSSETGGLVRRAAELLKEWRVADEAAACFWKEQPSFSTVADTLQSKKMIVVPVFAARGWYTDVVLPRELAKGRKDVEYVITPPVGEHHRMAELVVETATRALSVSDGSLDQRTPVADVQGSPTAVIVVGHGTSRHPGSRDTTLSIVERIREMEIADRALAAFLDDEPTIAEAMTACREFRVVVVPNFIARGGHVGDDIPKEILKVREGVNGPPLGLMYFPPGLTAEEIARMAVELAGNL